MHDVGGFMRAARRAGTFRGRQGIRTCASRACWRPGFVVTMEPGIYFIDQLLEAARARWRAAAASTGAGSRQLRKFGGIRIEDDLAVHRAGCENLTRDAFAHRWSCSWRQSGPCRPRLNH